MNEINFKKEVTGQVDSIVEKVTDILKPEGFGVLTRIDFHSKIKEKLNKDLPTTVILGVCNPSLAYEAYLKNTDITSLIPCNVVVRKVAADKVSVEMAKPSFMMHILGEPQLEKLAAQADQQLQTCLEKL